MKVTESEQLLLKHLQNTITPQERVILMRIVEESQEDETNGALPPQKILSWEEIWQRTALELPSFEDEKYEKIIHQINQKTGFDKVENKTTENSKKEQAKTTQNRTVPSATALSERIEYEEFEESEFQKRLKRRKSQNSWSAFGVVIIFAVALGIGLQYLNTYLESQPKEWKTKILSDSSKVRYTTDSRFVFPTEFRSEERDVQLAGLAEFDVKKQLTSFVLDAGSFKVRTKEGIFNVSSQDSLFVLVKEGNVTVYTISDTLANLKENQFLRYYPKIRKWEVKEVN
ncbi:FecR domain-containing protein [Bernardetia sp.]|uniref:FecR domain-containing protein n=1 Tax=Bernardetia sp. TaxID=1937974 RepID=UPI0025BFF5F9|nr:FecR domain-containing protein [Bernardetia sp.]